MSSLKLYLWSFRFLLFYPNRADLLLDKIITEKPNAYF